MHFQIIEEKKSKVERVTVALYFVNLAVILMERNITGKKDLSQFNEH